MRARTVAKYAHAYVSKTVLLCLNREAPPMYVDISKFMNYLTLYALVDCLIMCRMMRQLCWSH